MLFLKGFIMGISSLGVGSSILTQGVLDQLRAADEAQFIRPVDLSITNENDKKKALAIIDATMTNLMDSIDALKTPILYDGRTTSVIGTSAAVTAAPNSDIQDFTLDVVNLATKQIEQSGTFSELEAASVGSGGQIKLSIDGQDFLIDYTATTSLTELKDLINSVAGNKVDATVVQISSGQFSLFVSSADTGSTQDITISDVVGTLDARLTADFNLPAVQTGVDANFKFNGQVITRTSNNITDLIAGLDITLKEVGISTVSVAQNRDDIMSKIDSFVEKYNSAIAELNRMTKSSTESDERGIFSSESTIKSMKRALQDMMYSVGGGVGYLSDYGFDVNKDGVMSIDKDIFNAKMDENPNNVEAFFAGGTFTNPDSTTTVLLGAFNEIATEVEKYTAYKATLDKFKDSIVDRIGVLEERKTSTMERLDARYEILKKQFAAYDLMIAKLNTASSMFVQMANAQYAAQDS